MNLFEESHDCDCCSREYSGEGAILISPPDESGRVRKMDICTICFEWITEQGAEICDSRYTFTKI